MNIVLNFLKYKNTTQSWVQQMELNRNLLMQILYVLLLYLNLSLSLIGAYIYWFRNMGYFWILVLPKQPDLWLNDIWSGPHCSLFRPRTVHLDRKRPSEVNSFCFTCRLEAILSKYTTIKDQGGKKVFQIKMLPLPLNYVYLNFHDKHSYCWRKTYIYFSE